MNIRSLLLGSIMTAGLATTGYAADLGVVTSLDVCDELGLSGISISSDDTCLTISGEVSFSVSWEDGSDDADVSEDDTYVSLDFSAVSPTDFGPATAFISLQSNFDNGDNGFSHVDVDEAYVSVGDTTVVTAGYVTSLFESTVDVPDGAYDFDFFGFAGPLADPYETSEDGNVISFNVTHSVGDGFSIGGALEAEVTNGPDDTSIVGVASYAGNGIAAQGNFVYNTITTDMGVYAAFQGYFDPATVAAAVSFDGTDMVVNFGAAVVVDIFTLAGTVSYENVGADSTTVTGSLSADVTDTVTINLDSSYVSPANTWMVSAGVDVDVTETLTASFEVGTTDAAAHYATAGLTWEPVADTSFSAEGTAYAAGGWTASLSGVRTFD